MPDYYLGHDGLWAAPMVFHRWLWPRAILVYQGRKTCCGSPPAALGDAGGGRDDENVKRGVMKLSDNVFWTPAVRAESVAAQHFLSAVKERKNKGVAGAWSRHLLTKDSKLRVVKFGLAQVVIFRLSLP